MENNELHKAGMRILAAIENKTVSGTEKQLAFIESLRKKVTEKIKVNLADFFTDSEIDEDDDMDDLLIVIFGSCRTKEAGRVENINKRDARGLISLLKSMI